MIDIFVKIRTSKSFTLDKRRNSKHDDSSLVFLTTASFDIVRSTAQITLDALPKARRLSKLEMLLKSFDSIAMLSPDPISAENDGDCSVATTLLCALREHPRLRDFRFWDQGLSSCIKASRQAVGVSESLDLDMQEVNVTLGRLIPFAQHMRTVGWTHVNIRRLMRVYILTLPSHKETWRTVLEFLSVDAGEASVIKSRYQFEVCN